MSIRADLYAAVAVNEMRYANLKRAEREYREADENLNALIDRAFPEDHPNGLTVPSEPNKIALIKLIREASDKYARELGLILNDSVGCMGIKNAKDLIAEGLL